MKIVLYLFTILLVSHNGMAQKSIKEWSEANDKVFTKAFHFSNSLGFLKNSIKSGWVSPEQITGIKKIGMLSYVAIQPTFTEKTPTSIYTNYLTTAGSGKLIDKLFPIVHAGIKGSIEAKGMSYLLPEEYCNTEEKKSVYKISEFEPSALAGATAAIASFIRSPQMRNDPTGYMGKFVTMSGDMKVYRAIGKFAKEMSVDAMLTYEQSIWFDGKIMALGPLTITLIAPNPTPQTDKTSYAPFGPAKGYIEGLIYGSITLDPPKPFELAQVSKKNIEWRNLDGLELVYNRITTGLIDYMNEELIKLNK